MAHGTWTVVLEAERVTDADVVEYRFDVGGVFQSPAVPQVAAGLNPQKTVVLQGESTIEAVNFGVKAFDGTLESLRTEITSRLDADAPSAPGALRLLTATFVAAG